MRRAVGLAVGLCAMLAATTGVAVASEDQQRLAPAVAAAVPTETIGTVEKVGQALDYLGARRSMTFRHPGASYLKVHFNRLLLLPGDYVTVSNADGTESRRYTAGDAWAMSVDGDTAVVALHSARVDPAGLRSRLAGLGVGVDKYARGFTPTERKAREGREESVCGRDDKHDAACYRSSDPVAYNRSKAVARLLINGVELCSGWRVGPNNRMFTNHHCFTDTYSARNTEVWFNYECAVCGGWDVLRATKVWGDRVLATDDRLDYTLFSVQDFDTIGRFGYLQLDVRAPRAGEELYIPQHPGGEPTQIARGGNCAVADPSYWGYDRGTDLSYYCDTEGGSSGSPVLSRSSDRVIGLHHFGGCPNSGVRIDQIYEQVGNLL